MRNTSDCRQCQQLISAEVVIPTEVVILIEMGMLSMVESEESANFAQHTSLIKESTL